MKTEEIQRIISIVKSKGFELDSDTPSIGIFGNSRESSAKLIDLIINSDKRATTSLLWGWQAEGEIPAQVGELEIVVDWDKNPVAIIKYDEVFIIPFNEVTAEYAYDEAEGDRTLESWREGHWKFFTWHCEMIGRIPEQTMPVVCTRFQLLFIL
jgi:uncharacterized protein YhfF